MENRKYYSSRKSNPEKISLDSLKEIIFSVYEDFRNRGYFQEHFGVECVDGKIPGKIVNIEGYILRKLRKIDLWPFSEKYKHYSEEDLFDMIEFFFDHISAPFANEAFLHNWDNCGYHYKNFDDVGFANIEFCEEINQFLNDYSDGYELSARGEILSLFSPHLILLTETKIPTLNENIKNKMEHAATKFRKYGSTVNDRQDAIKSLVECLEFLRPEAKKVLDHKDEDDLFNIANNFAIRHANQQQKTNYDKGIWLSWMFYFYYATLMACLHLIRREKSKKKHSPNT